MKVYATPLEYFSQLDEESYFERLGKVGSVVNFKGVGRELEIELDEAKINADDCRELIALFYRYGNSLRSLRILSSIPGNEWINDSRTYWYEKMFDDHGTAG